MEELYNKWQLHKKDLGNTEPYQFTKSQLLDFAKYYLKANNSLIYCSPTEWRDVYFDD